MIAADRSGADAPGSTLTAFQDFEWLLALPDRAGQPRGLGGDWPARRGHRKSNQAWLRRLKCGRAGLRSFGWIGPGHRRRAGPPCPGWRLRSAVMPSSSRWQPKRPRPRPTSRSLFGGSVWPSRRSGACSPKCCRLARTDPAGNRTARWGSAKDPHGLFT